jgi:hypothetical protein
MKHFDKETHVIIPPFSMAVLDKQANPKTNTITDF